MADLSSPRVAYGSITGGSSSKRSSSSLRGAIVTVCFYVNSGCVEMVFDFKVRRVNFHKAREATASYTVLVSLGFQGPFAPGELLYMLHSISYIFFSVPKKTPILPSF